MSLYICNTCKFSSNLVCNYKRHLKTKKHSKNILEPTTNNIVTIDMKNNYKKFTCEYCLNKFKTFASKRRHENHRCKLIPPTTSMKKITKAIIKKDNEIDELKDKMNLLISKFNIPHTTIINNTTNNTIQLNSYGSEDLSHVTEQLKTSLLKIPYAAITKMIEVVHFNENKPENKNIIITNKKDNKIKIFSGNKWIYKNKEDAINNLINEKYFILDTHYDTMNSPKIVKNKNKNKYEQFRDKYDKNDKELIEKLKKECELVLLNNR